MIHLFLCSRAGRILAMLAVLGAAYKSSDWYASGRDYFQWRSEHYSVGFGPCYNCFREVGYWQEKGKGARGAESVCGYCGLTNTYVQDTVIPMRRFTL